VQVVTPFIWETHGAFLVNRGFVPDAKRDPAARVAGQVAGDVEVRGIVRDSSEPGWFTPPPDVKRRLWFSKDVASMAAVAGVTPIVPFFIEADATLTALSLKSWVFAAAVAAWLLSVLIEHRADVRRALAHSNREIRELAGRLIEAQEQERSRIARDLHDGVSQRLASASIELSTIRRGADAHSRIDLGHLQDELIGLSEDVRHLSHNLHPSMLHETGLEAAFASLCNTQRHRNGPSIAMRVMPNADNLPDAIALCLYRTAQEALNNAIRHARAQTIEIRLGIIDQQAQLNVDDDGIGFRKAGAPGQPRGLGLLSLEERAKLLGGTFQLTTGPGKGTHVCTRIPLQSRPR
jgi:two-component system sensor histidine kinase UhpB